MDGVKLALGSKGMKDKSARQCEKDGKEWRPLVHIKVVEFHAVISAWPCVFLDRNPAL